MSEPMADAASGLSALAHSEASGEVVARYDDWATSYDDDLAAWGYTVPTSIADELVIRLNAPSATGASSPVLDAGCGTGLIGRALHNRGIGPIDGVDASAESLREAAGVGVYRSLSAIDLSETLPLRDASYAATVCGGVLTYLADTDAVLRELIRVTRQSGWIIATQRTDLWIERDCDAVIAGLVADGMCHAVVGEPEPYLPGHDEYAETILVKKILLQRR